MADTREVRTHKGRANEECKRMVDRVDRKQSKDASVQTSAKQYCYRYYCDKGNYLQSRACPAYISK